MKYRILSERAVNLFALIDWRFIKLHKPQPGERDIPVAAEAAHGGALLQN